MISIAVAFAVLLVSKRQYSIGPKLLLVGLFLLLDPGRSFSQHQSYSLINAESGLPSSNIYEVLQDRKGYLWMATDEGVSRYDGRQFTTYSIENGLSVDDVWNIYEDVKGRIWMLSYGPDLVCYFNDSIQHITPPFDLLEADISGISEGPENVLWLPYTFGIICYDQTNFFQLDSSNSPFKETAVYLTSDEQGGHWFFCDRDLYYQLNGVFSKIPLNLQKGERYIDYPNVNPLFQPAENQFVIVTTQNIYTYSLETGMVSKHPISQIMGEPAVVIAPVGNRIMDEHLWLKTNVGIVVLDGSFNKLEQYDQFKNLDISHAFEDREGNHWLLQYGIGAYFVPGWVNQFPVVNISFPEEMGAPRIYSLGMDNRKRLLMGAEGGKLFVVEPEGKGIETVDLGWSGRLTQIQVDTVKNELIIGSYSGIWIVDLNYPSWKEQIAQNSRDFRNSTEPFSFFKVGDHLEYIGQDVKHLSQSADGNYLIVSSANGIFKMDLLSRSRTNISTKRAYISVPDPNGVIWIGRTDGLSRLSDGEEQYLGARHKQLEVSIRDLAIDSIGIVWIGTDGHGLIRYDDQSEEIYTLPETHGMKVKQVLIGPRGKLWMATEQGVKWARLLSHNPLKYAYGSIAQQDGILSNSIDQIHLDGENMYVASSLGVSVFNTSWQNEDTLAPSTYIEEVRINGEALHLAQLGQLPHNRNDISVTFSGISFRSMGEMRYRHRLVGWDEDWIKTAHPEVYYSNLPPGTYRFEVFSTDIAGNESVLPAVIDFEITPHWTQTLWFRGLLALVILMVLIGIPVFWLQQLRKKERLIHATDKEITRLEVQALQARMNPHFIFNSLNAIQQYIRGKDPEIANDYLARFARLIRMNLEITQYHQIPLQIELDYLEVYLWLEKLRFGDQLEYAIEVNLELSAEQVLIPGMIIQPFAENAIMHGLIPAGRPGYLKIAITSDSELLIIAVEDDGAGWQQDKPSQSSHKSRGIELIEKRLRLLFPNNHPHQLITVLSPCSENPDFPGTKVELRIPLKYALGAHTE